MDSVQYYLNCISQYDKEFAKWEKRADKILKRYRDDRAANSNETKYNILWANVQTLKAATFSKMPKPDVSRRFRDSDPVGRVAGLLLERALEFELTHGTDFASAMTACVYDRFLGGRGIAWVRYEPRFEGAEEAQVSEDAENELQEQVLDIESSPVDYVHWKDFGHEVARTWDEVTKVWRKVYMSRKMLVERFGEEVGKTVPLDSSPKDAENKDTEGVGKKALIYEIWDKDEQKAVWLSKSLGKILDERDDPLQLEEFWPCPKPLFSTLTNDSLVPVPDFTLYQDQANELDTLSTRIGGLVQALKVRGVYDSSVSELARLFTEGENNTLIPVSNWMAFAEKQGLKGAIDIVDITPLAAALQQAYIAMENVKQQVYDITGISDIVRGQSMASETATAQQIKGQYASLRLKQFQDEVANFASGLLKIKAQIICQHFTPETIVKIGGAEQLTETDRQIVPQALALLKNKPMRTFRIEVASDSMLYQDEQQEKEDRVEFLTATSGFIEKAVQASQVAPQIVPLLMDLLKFGVTGYRVGRTIEGEFDNVADQLKQDAANPQPQPSEAEIKAQQDAAKQQADMALEQQRMQMEQQARAAELQAEMMMERFKSQMETEREASRLNLEAQLEQARQAAEAQTKMMQMIFDRITKLEVAQISADATLTAAQENAAEGAGDDA